MQLMIPEITGKQLLVYRNDPCQCYDAHYVFVDELIIITFKYMYLCALFFYF